MMLVVSPSGSLRFHPFLLAVTGAPFAGGKVVTLAGCEGLPRLVAGASSAAELNGEGGGDMHLRVAFVPGGTGPVNETAEWLRRHHISFIECERGGALRAAPVIRGDLGIAVGSGIDPDFKVHCDAQLLLCVLDGKVPTVGP